MVASSRQKLHVEGNDLDRLIGRKNGRSLGVAGLLLLKKARMIVEVPRSQKSARYGSRNLGCGPERVFSRSVLSPKKHYTSVSLEESCLQLLRRCKQRAKVS